MFRKQLMLAFSLIVIASMVLSACAPKTVEVIKTVEVKGEEVVKTVEVEKVKEVVKTLEVEKVVEKEKVVEVTPTPQPTTRKGAWVDSVVFTEQNSADAAVSQLKAGEIDIYAYGVGSPDLYKTVQESPELTYSNSFGSADEMTFNTAVFSDTTKLNPFSNPKIREAMNWLIDRNYVVQEIFGGLAAPKLFCLVAAFPDYARYVDTARKLEAYYAYNPDKAKEIVTAEMEAMGAALVDGKWQFGGQPVVLIGLIRVEDARRQIGDYFANQLETLGFTVDRQYKTRSEASPIWVRGNPVDGLFNWYTGGWITTAVARDQGSNFSFYYTPRDYPIPLWQSYTPDPAFDEIALKLRNNDFTSMEERGELFAQAMEMSLFESVRVWVVDLKAFSPMKANTTVAYDLAGAIAGSQLWPYTVRFTGQEGGVMRISQPGIMVDPWNPIAGSNWIYDAMPIRSTQDYGVLSDPYTGLAWPQRIESASVVVKEGLPVAKTLDWVELSFEPEIQVPADAWLDWDAVGQKFITVGEKSPEGSTAAVKITVTYPEDLWTTVKWHDGSALSISDFIMGMILTFDTGKEDSAIYDAALAEGLAAFQAHFKGVRIVSTDPLVIETYDDLYQLDAELNVASWWPNYGYGPGAWHNLSVGIRAAADKMLAFSADKADADQIEWMSYISGPSLDILSTYLVTSTLESYVPYAPTMGEYVTADEAAARWANLTAWYEARHNFWLGTGPFYVYQVYPVEGTLTLQRYADFPDLANKWDRFGAPQIADVEVDGPGQVASGSEAVFDVFVTYKGQPYPAADISGVKFLVFNATGEMVVSGEAAMVAEGQYQVTLSAEDTAKLVSGANKLEVAVSPKVVSVPTFIAFEFVTP